MITVCCIILFYFITKVYERFHERNQRHKRNVAITAGVSASVMVSPILAAVAVGIGVPILLAYVYGVVPVSLCRSGSCTDASMVGETYERDTRLAVESLFSKTIENNKQENCKTKGVAEAPALLAKKPFRGPISTADTASTSNIIAMMDTTQPISSTSVQVHDNKRDHPLPAEDEFFIQRSASDSRALSSGDNRNHQVNTGNNRSPAPSTSKRSRSCSGKDSVSTDQREVTLSPAVPEMPRVDSATGLSERNYSFSSVASSIITVQPNVPLSGDT